MNGVPGKLIRGAVLLLACALVPVVHAQTSVPAKPTPARTDSTRTTAASPEQLDTGESITYLGRKLWFEVKRRMNLTTEAEEKQQRQAERNVRLKVGSIRVQATGGAAPKP
ncbi:MAG: hypothetical protein IPO05_06155 [Flavobacteriales bacterium]|jgi:hypothetical protein|nr:hypothetical protein [Flavobacteriales bacterium]MBP7450951.1 hypothetical protein [Flavobacteriales bacterium]HOZ41784.1 hypothetical protein [Flavobacteriales bacterium]